MSSPLVSVICLCYNHDRFLRDSIESVLNQSYASIELIIVDDASTDSSLAKIEEVISEHPRIKLIKLDKNVGNCSAFNIGFAQCNGDYIIDFAADDILLSNRIEVGVRAMEAIGNEFGVQFSDANLIDEFGNHLGRHSDKHPHDSIPIGDIYLEIIRRYFICSPTMLIRRSVFEKIGGYDEALDYEDFDFWVRSSRHFKYLYLPMVLVNRRIVSNSMRSQQFKRGSSQQRSTFQVCKKIQELNWTKEEKGALKQRVKYEIAMSFKLLNFELALNYYRLWRQLSH